MEAKKLMILNGAFNSSDDDERKGPLIFLKFLSNAFCKYDRFERWTQKKEAQKGFSAKKKEPNMANFQSCHTFDLNFRLLFLAPFVE